MDIFIIRGRNEPLDARVCACTMWSGAPLPRGLALAAPDRLTVIFREEFYMVECPVCDGNIDVDEEDVDEGDTISCDECGAALKVVGTDPLELESAEEEEEDE